MKKLFLTFVYSPDNSHKIYLDKNFFFDTKIDEPINDFFSDGICMGKREIEFYPIVLKVNFYCESTSFKTRFIRVEKKSSIREIDQFLITELSQNEINSIFKTPPIIVE